MSAGEGVRGAPVVFISYAHESDALREQVNMLADWLAEHGCRVLTDHAYRFRPPEEGWQAWMLGCIDKADVDVTNALLEVLDNGSFTVPPLKNAPINAKDGRMPLVIITTNEERELPAAFVRRCAVLNLNPPSSEKSDEPFVGWLVERGWVHRHLEIDDDAHRHAARQVLEGPHSLRASAWRQFIEDLRRAHVPALGLVPLGEGQLDASIPLPVQRWSPDASTRPMRAREARDFLAKLVKTLAEPVDPTSASDWWQLAAGVLARADRKMAELCSPELHALYVPLKKAGLPPPSWIDVAMLARMEGSDGHPQSVWLVQDVATGELRLQNTPAGPRQVVMGDALHVDAVRRHSIPSPGMAVTAAWVGICQRVTTAPIGKKSSIRTRAQAQDRSHGNNQTLGACMTCWAMSGSGARMGVGATRTNRKSIPGAISERAKRPAAWFVAAPGSTTPGGSGPPAATRTTRAMSAATWASACP